MSTSPATEPVYRHLEYRLGSNYRKMFIKGRRIRASVVDGTIHGPEPMSPEEFARDYQVPLEAVHEALDYVARNRALISEQRAREGADVRARGLVCPRRS
jgi:uncharacterized protein (DUF433 family)